MRTANRAQAEQQRLLQVALRKEFYRRNFEAFAREQIRIRGKRPGDICSLDITQRPAQLAFHKKIEEQARTRGWVRGRCVKARQQGLSTYSENRMLQGAVLTRNFNSLLIANDKPTTELIFNIARFAYDNLRPDYKPLTRYASKSELVFENPNPKSRHIDPGNNSRMTFAVAKEVTGTAATLQGLHTSETSKWPENACTMLENTLLPALHLEPGTIHLDESTAFYRGNYFREKCDAARSGKTSYFFLFVPWWYDPTYSVVLDKGEKFRPNAEERALIKLAAQGTKQCDGGLPPWELTFEQLKWRRITIADRADGERLFAQEYPHRYEDAWVRMDVNVYPLDALERQEANVRPPKWYAELKPSHAGNVIKPQLFNALRTDTEIAAGKEYIAIWKEPQPGRRYYLGIDVSLGIEGRNWSVGEVIDGETREQVAEAHILVDPDDLGWLMFSLGMYYNEAQINTELTGPGYNTDARLKKNGYPNLYFWKNRERIAPKITNLTGWKTSNESKRYLIGVSRSLLNHDGVIIRSQVLLDELRDFVVAPVFIQDQYYAETGDDDAVMAWNFALVAADDEDFGDNLPQAKQQRADPTEQRRLRELEVARAIAQGDWAVDNFEPGSGEHDGLSAAVGSLKGWD